MHPYNVSAHLHKLPMSTVQPVAQPLQLATLQPAALQLVGQPLQPSTLQPCSLQLCSQQLCSLHPCSLQMRKRSAALAERLYLPVGLLLNPLPTRPQWLVEHDSGPNKQAKNSKLPKFSRSATGSSDAKLLADTNAATRSRDTEDRRQPQQRAESCMRLTIFYGRGTWLAKLHACTPVSAVSK